MYAGCFKNLLNGVAARAFHIQSQECGIRRGYVYIGNLREPDTLISGADYIIDGGTMPTT